MILSSEKSISTKSRNNWLDIVRGLAIFGVVAVHSVQTSERIMSSHGGKTYTLFGYLMSLGRYGVELFFFLSGWLLISIYRADRDSVGRKYWIRRAGRILPLWILFLVVQIIKSYIGNGSSGWQSARSITGGEHSVLHSPFAIVLLTLTFTLWISASLWDTVIPGGWSIQAEVGHYLIFPIMRRYSINVILRTLTFVNIATLLLYYSFQETSESRISQIVSYAIDGWVRLNLFSTVGYFLIGIISYLLYSEYTVNGSLVGAAKNIGLKSKGTVLFSLTFVAMPLNFGTHIEALGYLIIMIIFSYFIHKSKRLAIIYASLGRYSYFIYFCHFEILSVFVFIANRYHHEIVFPGSEILVFAILFFGALVMSTLLAKISYKFFEGPIIRLSHKVK